MAGMLKGGDVSQLWKRFALLITVVAVSIPSAGATNLIAKFNVGGISGTAKFSQSELRRLVKLKIDILRGSTSIIVISNATWELRDHWVDLTVKNKCASAGKRYGNLEGSRKPRPYQWTIQLDDVKKLLGRSLYLSVETQTDIYIACATINMDISNVPYKYYVADIAAHIMGSVWFRYIVEDKGLEILTDLYVTGTTKIKNYKWNILSEGVNSCSDITSRQSYNPTNDDGRSCSTVNHAQCAVGDLSKMFGDVPVGSNKGKETKLFRNEHFINTGVNIASKIIIIVDKANNEVIGCGQIRHVIGKNSVVKFSDDGVSGSIKFKQESPFQHTAVLVHLANLRKKAVGYYIHNYPVPYKAEASQSICDASSVGGHFNPFEITKKVFPKTESMDRFEVGDISGKFGLLRGKSFLSETFWDSNLPMFGPNSIQGKSVVIHFTNGSRWVCSNIVETAAMITAVATFKYPVSGHVLLSQIRGDESGDTSVFVSLDYTDGVDHPELIIAKWTINSSPAQQDSLSDNVKDRCKSTQSTYNPNNVVTGNQYASQCGPQNQQICQVGDLTRKLTSSLNRTGGNAALKKFTFVDENLQLQGAHSVIGKSVVIYDPNSSSGAAIACANIKEIRTRVAKVNSWSDHVTGYIKFSQTSGVIRQFTDLDINMKNLSNKAAKYHVHLFPVPSGTNVKSPCDSESVGGHFNPFEVDIKKSPPPATGTNDKYEVGDLSGKFGLISNKLAYVKKTVDSNLNLFGLNSVVGRSVVIHKDDATASRWVCGSIVEDVVVTGGSYVQALATFSTSNTTLSGYIRLGQYVYPDGSYSDTSILMDVRYPDGKTKTLNHNWHIHENPVSGDGKATGKTCSSAGPHYNPYMVNKKTGYGKCTKRNPLRCELGDQANKLGTYDVGGGKRMFTDIDVPLTGPYSVLGRSFVIHVPERGPGRLACADIEPINLPVVNITIKKPKTVNKHAIIHQYSKALNTGVWNIAIIINDSKNERLSLEVYFSGENSTSLKQHFEIILKSEDKSPFGIFIPYISGSVCLRLSLLLLCLITLLRFL